MIIKASRAGQWNYFGGVTSFRFEYPDNDKGIVLREGDYDLRLCDSEMAEAFPSDPAKRVVLVNMMCPEATDRRGLNIIAYAPIYVMNDEGKTIEVIY